MSHRGRLNVIINIVSRPAAEIFAGFEDVDPRSVLGGGDVKYHIGATGIYTGASGREVRIHLVSNPSHLEAVDPVALGRARAKQTRLGRDGKNRVLPVLMHGDTAFAGQGITAETLNLANLRGYTVGGTVHVIVNNLHRIHHQSQRRLFRPLLLRSGQAAADSHLPRQWRGCRCGGARRPHGAGVSLRVRQRCGGRSDRLPPARAFRGGRPHHHPADSLSQDQRPSYCCTRFMRKNVGLDPRSRYVAEVPGGAGRRGEGRQEHGEEAGDAQLPSYWAPYHGGPYNPGRRSRTPACRRQLRDITDRLVHYPDDFHIHPKVQKLLEQRREMGYGKRPLDFGMAEALAFGSLALEGVPIRISGQDSRRGTFNQRHSVLIDIIDEKEYVPLCHLSPGQARVEIYNSELSEAAVMGFEYGYARDYPEALVAWEAQFGDFANGAQIIIDQFIAAGEDKWDLLSGLVLLLPHGHEGQGPEHSSARIERYLQLCARDNMQVCQPSTAGQYFHLLRRQALRKWRKPLICFTPKSMLRHPEALSPLSRPGAAALPERHSGRDRAGRASGSCCAPARSATNCAWSASKLKIAGPAIVSLEQIYPFPEDEMQRDPGPLQERARNSSGCRKSRPTWARCPFVTPRLKRILGSQVRSIKRAANATPATGSAKAHELEQKTLIYAGAGQGRITLPDNAGSPLTPQSLFGWSYRSRFQSGVQIFDVGSASTRPADFPECHVVDCHDVLLY